MAKERNNKEVKTHLNMVAIYDKFHDDHLEKTGIDLTATQVTMMCAAKVIAAGGFKV